MALLHSDLKTKSTAVTVVELSNYQPVDKKTKAPKGDPIEMIRVGPEGGNQYNSLNGSLNRWSLFFGPDKDGDSIIATIYSHLISHPDIPNDMKDRMKESAKKFAEQVMKA